MLSAKKEKEKAGGTYEMKAVLPHTALMSTIGKSRLTRKYQARIPKNIRGVLGLGVGIRWCTRFREAECLYGVNYPQTIRT